MTVRRELEYYGGRVEDEEILFTSLVLMFGEPPYPPKHHSPLSSRLAFNHAHVNYALRVKDMMGELSHNPHQGLYTEFVHWCKEQWNEAEQIKTRKAQAASTAAILRRLS